MENIAGFIGLFVMAQALLSYCAEAEPRRAALLEFGHVPCLRRRVRGDRCAQVVDVVEIVLDGHGLRERGLQSVRSVGRQPDAGRFEHRFQRRRFADIAADHERAARCAEPVLVGCNESATASAKPTSRSAALKDLFAQIDGDGDGKVTKSEFENALGAGGTNLKAADSVFSKLDQNGDDSVSLDEMMKALLGTGGKGRRHHHRADGSSTDPLLKALEGASSTSTTNSDGSTTTSLTYADGSKVTLMTPAKASSSSAATSSYNFIEQMIQRQAQSIASAATASLSVSV